MASRSWECKRAQAIPICCWQTAIIEGVQLHFEALSAERSHVMEAGELGVREPVGSSWLPRTWPFLSGEGPDYRVTLIIHVELPMGIAILSS
jgi:hypothetical protein